MKHIVEKKVPARIEQVVERITCDLCGKTIKDDPSEVDEVEVKHRTGEFFPGYGHGEETSVDMCGDCFDTKLVPWLRSQGAEPRTIPWGD